MQIKKTNESWHRTFDADGKEVETRLESAQYNIVDNDGTTIGNATIYPASANINVYGLAGFNNVEEGVDKLKALFNIED